MTIHISLTKTTMKKIAALVLSLSLGMGIASAQKNERQNAYLNMNSYNNSKDKVADSYLLDRAKAAIDKAAVHPDTKDDIQVWLYRGQIYLLIFQKEFNSKMDSHKDVTDQTKKKMLSFQETDPASLLEATNAFLRAKSLDTRPIYDMEWTNGLNDCYTYLQNVGISRFNQKMYKESYPMFELAADIVASQKKFDTVNTSNAAVAAYNAKIYDKASMNYKKLADAGYGKGNTWTMLGRVYAESGDSAKYISTISEGLKKYPNDAELLTEDVNIKMHNGQAAAAIDELNALVAQRPNDAQLNFVVGNVYDRMANPTGADGKPTEKPKNYEELLGKAAEYYKKSIEIDPKNFDALYNLGALYYNQSVEYSNRAASSIADAAKYNDMWEKPLPDAKKYLEEAYKINPKDLVLLSALKAVYGQLGENDNYMRIKDEIKKIQAGG
jgi:tetratricopeptide (TPR) repeat protein